MIDLDLRDWLLILGPLLIAGVLLHGYWKMRRATPKLKMSLAKEFQSSKGQESDMDDLALLRAELPNGGARIVKQDPVDRNTSDHVADINLEEDVPVLMDPVQLAEDTNEGIDDQLEFDSPIPGELLNAKRSPRPEQLFVMNVLSKKDGFNGQYLLESLVTCGFQFGYMDIFHYLDNKTGEPIFSLVNAVEPGTFDPNTMDQLVTPGVSLFIKLHELDDPEAGFKQMIETAEQLAAELDAEIKDGKHNSITQQALEHEMQIIREYSVKYPSPHNS